MKKIIVICLVVLVSCASASKIITKSYTNRTPNWSTVGSDDKKIVEIDDNSIEIDDSNKQIRAWSRITFRNPIPVAGIEIDRITYYKVFICSSPKYATLSTVFENTKTGYIHKESEDDALRETSILGSPIMLWEVSPPGSIGTAVQAAVCQRANGSNMSKGCV